MKAFTIVGQILGQRPETYMKRVFSKIPDTSIFVEETLPTDFATISLTFRFASLDKISQKFNFQCQFPVHGKS